MAESKEPKNGDAKKKEKAPKEGKKASGKGAAGMLAGIKTQVKTGVRKAVRAVKLGVLTVGAGGCAYLLYDYYYPTPRRVTPLPSPAIPSRIENLARLKAASEAKQTFDIAVIGGGAMGSGIALDAASRGLNVCLFEADDFASGSSSRSSKLLHGGFPVLERALRRLDWGSTKVIQSAIEERETLLHLAPHVARPIPLILPIYKWTELPLHWLSLKLYDLLAIRSRPFPSSRYISANEALMHCQVLDHTQLKGAMLFYEGVHDDSRMNLYTALTAAHHGACVMNHMAVKDIAVSKEGKVTGLTVQDTLPLGSTINVSAKVVINATGPQSDGILAKHSPAHKPITKPVAGAHITLPSVYTSKGVGVFTPGTVSQPGFVMLPYNGVTIVGTTATDSTNKTSPPVATAEDVSSILTKVKRVLKPGLPAPQALSAWAGLRSLPLRVDTSRQEKKDFVLLEAESGLLTVVGGNWSIYRKVAEATVNKAVFSAGLQASKCDTKAAVLLGGHKFSSGLASELGAKYKLSTAQAGRLVNTYGDRANEVAEMAAADEFRTLPGAVSSSTPLFEKEVEFAIAEYATTAADFLVRRSELALLDCKAAAQAVPRVVEIMGGRLGWSAQRRKDETNTTLKLLDTLQPKAK